MKPLDTLDAVIRGQQVVTLTFNDVMQAESYMVMLRRYKTRYPGMYFATRKGKDVIVSPQAFELLPAQKHLPTVKFSSLTGETNDSLRIKTLLLNDYRDSLVTEEDAIQGLVSNGICPDEEAAKTLLENYLKEREDGND
jgi:hypothetical protein